MLIVFGILDGVKYRWNTLKICKNRTAKSFSRKFINTAIISDLSRLMYGIVIKDTYIIIVSLIALYFMCELFWYIYLFYPFRCRGLCNFRRPNIFLYILNSILPNRIRRRL